MNPFTRQDLSVTYSTSAWGGQVALVTVQFPQPYTGEPATRTFELKSTEGLPNLPGGGHGIHLGEVREHVGGREDWRGAFRTLDMEQALYWFVDYLNALAERQEVATDVESALGHLQDAMADFYASLEDSSRRDFRAEWDRVREAFVAVDMVVRGSADEATADTLDQLVEKVRDHRDNHLAKACCGGNGFCGDQQCLQDQAVADAIQNVLDIVRQFADELSSG